LLERLVQRGTSARWKPWSLFNTGAAQKYFESSALQLPRIDKDKPLTL